jgi:hypothetical protein
MVATAAAGMVRERVAALLRLPDEPVKVTVVEPVAAVAEAVSEILWATPGVRVSVEGLAVTPLGSPVIATATGLANPLTESAMMLVLCPAAPKVRVSEEGERSKQKLGGEVETVSATVAVWLSVPELAVKVMVAVPAAEVQAAARVIFCAVPGIRLKVEGDKVTPEGIPVAETDTVPENSLSAVAITLITCPAPPEVRVAAEGERVTEKSAG